jgi:hypothetical protein
VGAEAMSSRYHWNATVRSVVVEDRDRRSGCGMSYLHILLTKRSGREAMSYLHICAKPCLTSLPSCEAMSYLLPYLPTTTTNHPSHFPPNSSLLLTRFVPRLSLGAKQCSQLTTDDNNNRQTGCTCYPFPLPNPRSFTLLVKADRLQPWGVGGWS